MAEQKKPKHSSQGPLTIWHGMNLSTMFRFFAMKPALHWSRLHRIATLPAFAAYNSVLGGVESLLYGRRIARTEIHPSPVFILGYWRSGTTLLHNLMTADPQFTSPTLYHCVFPWHFLLTEKINTWLTAWMVPQTRPMDNIPISWNTPQEDDIGLCTMSLVSPYTVMARPSDLLGWKRSLDLDSLPDRERRRWEDSLITLMKKVTIRDSKPIVMKSPSHTYRIKQILRLFPDAKFVYIHRNPYEVIRSAIHLRKTMAEENCLGRVAHQQIEADVIDSFMQAFDSYEEYKSLVPAGHLCEVRYETLARDPLGELERIYREINLPGFDRIQAILEPQIPELKRYKKNEFQYDPELLTKVYHGCRPVFEHFGYSIPDELLDVVKQHADRLPRHVSTGAA